MSKNRNKKFIGGLAVALLLPLSFYVVAKLLAKDKVNLPKYYGVERVDTRKGEDGAAVSDTVYRTLSDLALTNQLGRQVSLNKDLPGKILVVNFFFVNCPTVCPKLSKSMSVLQTAFTKDPKKETAFDTTVHFVSITVQPEADSFPALRAYADSYRADHDRWWFLTGDRNAIYNYAHNQLGLVMGATDGGADEMTHTQKLVLIDKERHIRGYYDGLDPADLKRCADDIILLSIEKKRKKK